MTMKRADQLVVGEVSGNDFGPNIGCQWAFVTGVEVGETETKVTFMLSRRFGCRSVVVTYKNSQPKAYQSLDTFVNWLKMYDLDLVPEWVLK